MCLAVPAKVIECRGDEAVVDLQGSTLKISRILTPDAGVGDWVLVHAGFAITQLGEAEARETWEYLRQALGEDAVEEGIAGSDEDGKSGAPPSPCPLPNREGGRATRPQSNTGGSV